MHQIAAQIEAEVDKAAPLLLSMAEDTVSRSAEPNQWSKKQLLGHLIDSAANNQQRFVRTAQISPLMFPPYDQEFWVQLQSYQEANWADLVVLWQLYNKHLAFFVKRLPKPALQNECVIGPNQPATLEWLIADYLRHLQHHLNDLLRPPTKSDLLVWMEQARGKLEQTIGRLSEAQLTTPDPKSDWTIKDHLAHLATWEVGIAALLQRQPRWEAMGLDETMVAANKMDELNDIIYQHHKNRPLAEILAYFHETHRQMLAALAGLSDEDLFKPYAHYQQTSAHYQSPGTDEFRNRPIIDWVIGNTYEHYDEHRAWIKPLLKQGK